MIELMYLNKFRIIRINFRIYSCVGDGCHDLLQKSVIFDDVSITIIGKNDYRIHFWDMTKDEAVSRMKNSDISEKLDNYEKEKIKIILYFLF